MDIDDREFPLRLAGCYDIIGGAMERYIVLLAVSIKGRGEILYVPQVDKTLGMYENCRWSRGELNGRVEAILRPKYLPGDVTVAITSIILPSPDAVLVRSCEETSLGREAVGKEATLPV